MWLASKSGLDFFFFFFGALSTHIMGKLVIKSNGDAIEPQHFIVIANVSNCS